MQEVKIGDIVSVHQPDGSVADNIVVNVISLTEVQLINPKVSNSVFDAATALIYKRGTQRSKMP
ncbi:MAG: hypothetical protein H0V70_15145 [Ktedonobacteraceae bacterium]|nr:hypothetical protein [Ktedonobacteraceae bacterium]